MSSDNNAAPSSSSVTGRELVSGLTQLLVLLILRKGPQHGYELASLLEPIYGRRLSPGTIYPLLRRMEKKTYVQSRSTTASGRKRRTYVITRLGRIAMENAQSSLQSFLASELPEVSIDDPGMELLKSLAQFRILLILEKSPLHGYDLVDRLHDLYGQKIALGTIYPSLHRLADKGYISAQSKWDGDRERKVYELTSLGKEAIRYALDEVRAIASGTLFPDL